MAQSRSKDQFM